MNTQPPEKSQVPKRTKNQIVGPPLDGISGGPFRVRQPLPFGRHELWPSEYPTLGDAIREVDRIGNTAVEIINAAGDIVCPSKNYFRKMGKDGRP
jgi:hypothetical protein